MNYTPFACLVVLLWPTIAIADTRSVDVHGIGVITVDPNVAFLEGQLYGSGETAADAQEDFEKNKKEFSSAINPKSFEGVEVSFRGVTTSRVPEGSGDMGIGVRVMGMAGNMAPGEPGEFVVGEKIRISIRNLKPEDFEEAQQTLVRLVDAVNEAEVLFSSETESTQMQAILGNAAGMKNLMHFSHSDLPAARRRAMKQAIDEARKSAEEIATLTDSKLGKVLQVSEVEDLNTQSSMTAIYGMGSQQDEFESSEGLGEINVRIKVRVKFELVDP